MDCSVAGAYNAELSQTLIEAINKQSEEEAAQRQHEAEQHEREAREANERGAASQNTSATPSAGSAAAPAYGQPATGQQQCPPGASASVPSSSTQPGASALVACVGSQAINVTTFEHWAAINERSGSGAKHHPKRTVVIEQVMGFLIQADWISAEAAALGIHVSTAKVQRTFEHYRHQTFPRRREFRRFLRRSGERVADLLLRVKVGLLSGRILKHALAGHHSARSQKRALQAFVTGFKDRWQAQTYCAPAYDVPECGHVDEGL